jgi:hypothetical protein
MQRGSRLHGVRRTPWGTWTLDRLTDRLVGTRCLRIYTSQMSNRGIDTVGLGRCQRQTAQLGELTRALRGARRVVNRRQTFWLVDISPSVVGDDASESLGRPNRRSKNCRLTCEELSVQDRLGRKRLCTRLDRLWDCSIPVGIGRSLSLDEGRVIRRRDVRHYYFRILFCSDKTDKRTAN